MFHFVSGNETLCKWFLSRNRIILDFQTFPENRSRNISRKSNLVFFWECPASFVKPWIRRTKDRAATEIYEIRGPVTVNKNNSRSRAEIRSIRVSVTDSEVCANIGRIPCLIFFFFFFLLQIRAINVNLGKAKYLYDYFSFPFFFSCDNRNWTKFISLHRVSTRMEILIFEITDLCKM